MAKYKVLSTKKLEPSLVEKARENDIEIIEQEFISIRPVDHSTKLQDLITRVKSGNIWPFVFTSQNAVYMFDQMRYTETSTWGFFGKTFCLSGKTKEAVLNYGLEHISKITSADNATSLAQKIIESDIKEVIFFCGSKRREELPSLLKQAGVVVHEMVVYETIETPTIAEENLDAILFFSPSAVQSFFSVNSLQKGSVCFAIGQTTADSIADFTDNKIIVSESPSQEMMLAAVTFYFQNINCYE